jgi:hypothetical protein
MYVEVTHTLLSPLPHLRKKHFGNSLNFSHQAKYKSHAVYSVESTGWSFNKTSAPSNGLNRVSSKIVVFSPIKDAHPASTCILTKIKCWINTHISPQLHECLKPGIVLWFHNST